MAADLVLETPVSVAPLSGNEHNTVRERLIPTAAWQIDDVRFVFDSSFVLPEASGEFALLAAVRQDNPRCPISLFGHADPVGDDEYNKVLSGRRAIAIYAVLTRRTDLWEQLHAKPHGRDKWDRPVFDAMREALKRDSGDIPATAAERQALYGEYMNLLCRDLGGTAYQLDATADFLARGANKDGIGDRQGCGEFNAELLLSRDRQAEFAKDKDDHAARDEANAPNRRVVAIVFAEGSHVDPKSWPCPKATDGTAACRKRFWSDAAVRRSPSADDRKQLQTQNTYACRFYERLAPPQLGANRVVLVTRQLRLLTPEGEPMTKKAWRFQVSGVDTSGVTGDDGIIAVRMTSSATEAKLVLDDAEIAVAIERVPTIQTVKGVQVRLRNLGYYRDEPDGKAGPATSDAVHRFQADRNLRGVALAVSGEIDDATRAELVRYHGS